MSLEPWCDKEVGVLIDGMCYFSFVCDALDGWFARKFNQGIKSSIFIIINFYVFLAVYIVD